MREISAFKEIVGRVWDHIRSGGEGVSPESEKDIKMENSSEYGDTGKRLGQSKEQVGAVRLDEGRTLMLSARADEVVALAVRMFVKEIGGSLG
jgi:hypothetical protein